MRRDVLTGDWVSIAAARQNRVFLRPAELDPLAPADADQPVRDPVALRRRGVREPSAVVRPGARRRTRRRARRRRAPRDLDDLDALGLGRTRTSVGRCEVVCFSPEHAGSFGTPVRRRAPAR